MSSGDKLADRISAGSGRMSVQSGVDGAFNKHDATAVGALYTANAVQTTPAGSFSGREASKLSVGGTAAV